MSKIKLTHSSGNSMSIGAPATNPASDLELKLPATIGSANQLLKNSSTAGTLEFSSLTESTGALGLTGSGNTTFDISTGNNSGDNSKLSFSDTADTGIGSINYDHGTNILQFTVAGTESMRIKSTGEWSQYGYTAVAADTAADDLVIGNADSGVNRGMTIFSHPSQNGALVFGDSDSNFRGAVQYIHGSDNMRFLAGGNEIIRIHSGGCLSLNNTGEGSSANGYPAMYIGYKVTGSDTMSLKFRARADVYNTYHLQFEHSTNNAVMGNITSGNTSSVSYNTSSDYRLKENQVAISDGITRLKLLKPYKFNFKVLPDTTVDGFFAHEVTPAVPEAITGKKDEMKSIYYQEGDTIPSGKNVGDFKEFSTTEINPQGIDQSKLVPLLTAALQEAIAKIETLETKVAALESA